MKLYQKIILEGFLLTGLSGLVGCSRNSSEAEQYPSAEQSPYSFASVDVWSNSGMAMTSGDFDGDGDLDLIVGARSSNNESLGGNLYLFKNDGKGNFSTSK